MEADRQVFGELCEIFAALGVDSDADIVEAQQVVAAQAFGQCGSQRVVGVAFVGAEVHAMGHAERGQFVLGHGDGALLGVGFAHGESLKSADVGHYVAVESLGQYGQLREYVALVDCVEIVAVDHEEFLAVGVGEIAQIEPGGLVGCACRAAAAC